MGTVRLELGDCLDVLKTMDESSVDSIVTDPPYELGFMGKEWDSTGIANNVELWRECLRVLKPGGHLLAFSGTRTYHRMASAIEDAGFEVRDMIEWVYSTGFPKSLNIGKAVDKLQGNEREVVGKQTSIANKSNDNTGRYNWNTENQIRKESIDITKGTSEWEGWGTALKPAHEPIVLARKPLSEKSVSENVLKHGTGGINVDGCRVEAEPELVKNWDRKQSISAQEGRNSMNGGLMAIDLRDRAPSGRFPANLIHDNSEEVRECFPETKQPLGSPKIKDSRKGGVTWGNSLNARSGSNAAYVGDSGNTSRFFKSIVYRSKASKKDRNEGLEGFEEKDASKMSGGEETRIDRPTNHPRMANHHPTVKPTDLMRYLCRMVTPPGGTVLDPFMGSGSTGKAAALEGFSFIGIEREPEYLEISKARIAAVPQVLL